MITFLCCLVLLVVAYFTYGKYLEKVCKIDANAEVPSAKLYDGVDYVPMPRWRTFLIQLLNIAGTGPIFGAILGACYGPVAFLWITFGGIFMGAMHDYLSGVILVRNDGLSITEIVARYLGKGAGAFMRIFSVLLLILVGVVFVVSPADILSAKFDILSKNWWLAIIIAYYFIATLLPVDKLIGKIYPLFGVALVAMALGLLGVLFFGEYKIPDMTLENLHVNKENLPLVPTLFITIACGAISGFHATQSPLMARCVNNERECRFVFYGSMISESVIALIWAAISIAFFYEDGGVSAVMAGHTPAWAVNEISNTTLGVVGGILAILGVVAAPITSGDTAFRSARLIIADVFHIEQKTKWKRLAIALPLFSAGVALTFVDFDVVWRYFAWTNQALASVVLWCIVVYLHLEKSNYWVALIPAVFMTYICSSFVFVSNQFVGMGAVPMAYVWGGVATVALTGVMVYMMVRNNKSTQLKK
ncbi:MAG: carbon starvation protein A [Rikenellaceae bacterium]|nr:carbon starvation protein A [Rikenellaceae bacterium]